MKLKPSYNPEHRTIIEQFIKTKVGEAGARGVVLGLSGGLDSAVIAALAAEALGKDKVRCLIMPYNREQEQERESVEHAIRMAEEFELEYKVIPIKESVDAVLDTNAALDRDTVFNADAVLDADTALGSADLDDVRKKVYSTASGNVRARIRMVNLFYFANLNKFLVLGTSNKSELMVGYFTKFGDGGNDAMPIGDLYKTEVFELGRELGIPDVILKKPPTAGLVKGQTDEKDLGISYPELDRILYGIERWLGLEDIAEITGIPLEAVQRIQSMIHRSAHKRYLGMIPKIGLRTPGFDWRENVSLLSFSHEPLD